MAAQLSSSNSSNTQQKNGTCLKKQKLIISSQTPYHNLLLSRPQSARSALKISYPEKMKPELLLSIIRSI